LELPIFRGSDPLNNGTCEASTAKWRLIPSWERAPDGGRKPINARIETLAESRLFAPLLRRKRCAIFADGFYEWATEDGKKNPYHFRFIDTFRNFGT